ncbi:MAG: hypothetical protein JRD68_00050 [Deltaproteobacteria bacterium]|nr:hypothetical protein [Deltaproteobacteria bacterium]
MATNEVPMTAAETRKKFYGGYYDERHVAMPLGHLIGIMQQASSNDMHYRGFRCNKHPCDAWAIQEIIYETQPQVIIEIGRQDGGSALFLRDLLKAAVKNWEGVFSIDILPAVDFSVGINMTDEGIVQFQGDSENLDIIAKVARGCVEYRTMVIDDCSHTYENVMANLKNYGPLVSEGCYYIVEDMIINHGLFHARHAQEGNDLMAAVQDFMAGGGSKRFEVERSREKWYITSNPGGYLRRLSVERTTWEPILGRSYPLPSDY